MPSRNCITRHVSWRIARNEQLVKAVSLVGWEAAWTFVNIIVSVDNLGRIEGGKYQLRDWFFPLYDNVMPEKVEQTLIALAGEGLIIRYQHKGLWYIQLPKVGNWNYIKGNMSLDSDFPPPSTEEIKTWENTFGETYAVIGSSRNGGFTKYKHGIHGVGSKVEAEVEVEVEVEAEAEGKLLDAWNASGLPKTIALSTGRKEKLRQRLKSKHFRENYSAAITKLAASSFVKGNSKTGWKVSIDWFIANDNNYIKALEGKYDDNKGSIFDKY